MKKIGGWIIAIVGLVVLASQLIPTIAESIPIINSISKWPILIIGLILVVVGVIVSSAESSKTPKEVPIYEGKSDKVIGYRRHKK